MSKQIHVVAIRASSSEPQQVQLPRRARITGLTNRSAAVQIYAEISHDEDTKAFDTRRHQRAFVVVKAERGGDNLVPSDGQLVGFVDGIHVYEVKP